MQAFRAAEVSSTGTGGMRCARQPQGQVDLTLSWGVYKANDMWSTAPCIGERAAITDRVLPG